MKSVYALVVGIDRYDQPAWDIQGPCGNALAVCDRLLAMGVRPTNIHAFLEPNDDRCNKAIADLEQQGVVLSRTVRFGAIEEFWRSDLKQLGADLAQLVIYWSGHGITDADGDRIFFCRDFTTDLPTRVLNCSKVLRHLRTADYQRFTEQILLADVCGAYSPVTVSPDKTPADSQVRAVNQVAFFATPEGEYATIGDGIGPFTTIGLSVLQQFETWPNPTDFSDRMKAACEEAGQQVFRQTHFDRGESVSNQLTGNRLPFKEQGVSRIYDLVSGPLLGREEELSLLTAAWADADINVFEFVALGGAGKTALLAKWLGEMQEAQWRGADRVFAHSFYSQGSDPSRAASAEGFLSAAIHFFGDGEQARGSDWEQGERLAKLVLNQFAIIVLDGVEPLQYPSVAKGQAGKLRDSGLAAFLTTVARSASEAQCLCVITTRQSVANLHFNNSRRESRQLDSLPPAVGAQVLRELEVKGSEQQLEAASAEVHGHGLSLNLLGSYLRDVYDGDVEKRHGVGLATIDQRDQASRLMERYEDWLNGRIDIGGPAPLKRGGALSLEIWRLTGLFDRPVTHRELAALCSHPPIPGLTDLAASASDEDLLLAINDLAKSHLLLRISTFSRDGGSARVIDAHPLIREYFAAKLASDFSSQLSEAHERLYAHLLEAIVRDDSPAEPDLSRIQMLCRAVDHGVAADRHDQCFGEILIERVFILPARRLFGLGGMASVLLPRLRKFYEGRRTDGRILLSNPGDHARLLQWTATCLVASHGFVHPDVRPTLMRALALLDHAGDQQDKAKLSLQIGLLRADHFQGEFHLARDRVSDIEQLANRVGARGFGAIRHAQAETDLYLGDFESAFDGANDYLQTAPATSAEGYFEVDTQVALLCLRAWCHVYMGRPGAAVADCEQAMTRAHRLKEESGTPQVPTLGMAHYYSASVFLEIGPVPETNGVERLREHSQALAQIGEGMHSGFWASLAEYTEAIIDRFSGRETTAEQKLSAAIDKWARSARRGMTRLKGMLADLQCDLGIPDAAREVEEALNLRSSGEGFYDAELYRVRGKVQARSQEDRSTVRATFETAIETARKQSAAAFELRATLDFARYLQASGQPQEATDRLRAVYERLDQSFMTFDLLSAGRFLEE